jgi:hypothetical protein
MGYHYTSGVDFTYADLYVATSGNDMNSGTNQMEALRSLTKALTKAGNGTTIHMGAGRYTNGVETFPLEVSGLTGLTIEGAGRNATVIDASGANMRVMHLNSLNNSVLSSLTIAGGKIDGASWPGAGLYIQGSVVELEHCAVSNCFLRGATSYGAGIYVDIGSVVTLIDSIVASNMVISTGGGWPSYGSGIHNAGTLTMEQCMLVRNNNSYWTGALEYGGALFNSGAASLRNCLICRNTASDRGAGCYGSGGTLSLVNCTVADNAADGVCRAGGVMAATNCILWANGLDVTGSVMLAYCDISDGTSNGVNGCISVNPLFVNTNIMDYRVLKESHCVNAGVKQSWMNSAVDLDGNPRVRAGKVDMGAYECQSVGGTMFVIR